MSRVGLAPIAVPNGVEININGQDVEVKGPKGTQSVNVPDPITINVEDGILTVSRPDDHRKHRALHGLSRSLLNSAVIGVTEGFTIKMEIFGVGYRVQQKGQDLEFSLGYSTRSSLRLRRESPSQWTAQPSCPLPVLTSN